MTKARPAFPVASSPSGAMEAEMRQWANAIRTGTNVVVKPEQALVVSEMLEALSTSTNTGKSIDFQRALCTHLFTSIRRQ